MFSVLNLLHFGGANEQAVVGASGKITHILYLQPAVRCKCSSFQSYWSNWQPAKAATEKKNWGAQCHCSSLSVHPAPHPAMCPQRTESVQRTKWYLAIHGYLKVRLMQLTQLTCKKPGKPLPGSGSSPSTAFTNTRELTVRSGGTGASDGLLAEHRKPGDTILVYLLYLLSDMDITSLLQMWTISKPFSMLHATKPRFWCGFACHFLPPGRGSHCIGFLTCERTMERPSCM